MSFVVQLWEFMRERKKFWLMPIVVMMLVFGGLAMLTPKDSAVAPAQQDASPPNVPKPTKASIQEVIQIITNDKSKVQSYCDLIEIYAQMNNADKKNDSKAVEALANQGNELISDIGPEYRNLAAGWDQIDQNSSEGKEIVSMLNGLANLCTK